LAFSNIKVFALGVTNAYILLLLIFVFIVLININFTKQFFFTGIKVNLFLLLSLGIIFFFIISSFYVNLDSTLEPTAILKLLIYPIIISFFFFYIPRLIYLQVSLFEKFLSFWLVFSMFSIFIAFVALILGLDTKQEFPGAAFGFYITPNIFAFVFTFAVPIILYKYFVKRISLITFIFLLVSALSCLLFTYSRAGYIGVFTALIIQMYKRSKLVFIGGLILIAVLTSTFILNFAQSKGNTSTLLRYQLMYVGYDMITNNGIPKFLWGYGVNNSREVFVKELTYNFGLSRAELGPHNVILSLGIQFGMLLTFFCLTLIMLLILKASFLKKDQTEFEIAQRINLSVAIIIGILAECMFEDLIIYPECYAMPLFLVFLGYLRYCVFGNKHNRI
jgi:hypothetical protein